MTYERIIKIDLEDLFADVVSEFWNSECDYSGFRVSINNETLKNYKAMKLNRYSNDSKVEKLLNAFYSSTAYNNIVERFSFSNAINVLAKYNLVSECIEYFEYSLQDMAEDIISEMFMD